MSRGLSPPVLIIKASRSAFHHGSLAVARTLGKLGVPVYAVVDSGFTPLAFSRYITGLFVCDSFEMALLPASIALGRGAVLIPMDDRSAIYVADNAEILKQRFLFPDVPLNLPRQLADKAQLFSLCRQHGISCPEISIPLSDRDLAQFIERASFPIMVKAVEQWHLINGRQSSMLIKDKDALLKLYDEEKRSRIMLQEFIPGDDWIYHGYVSKDLTIGFTGQKLLSYPAGAGSTALGRPCHCDNLRDQSEAFLKTVGYSGIIDMDWRRDARDGQYKLVDCNPRIGQNFRMFETKSGMDVVRAMYFNLSGRHPNTDAMIDNRLFTVESFCLPLMLDHRAAKCILNPKPQRELAWWSWEDPLPFFLMGIRKAMNVARRKPVMQFSGWTLIVLITALSLAPHRPKAAPHLVEHFLIFAAAGFAFGAGYMNRWTTAIALIAFTGLIEAAQLLVTGRHARLSDFLIDAAAACVGVALSCKV